MNALAIKVEMFERLADTHDEVLLLKLDKYKLMFYRLVGSTLTIVDFWDTRQDPRKRPY